MHIIFLSSNQRESLISKEKITSLQKEIEQISEDIAAAARKGTPETARLQRELDISIAEGRDLREKLSRTEEESERMRNRLENRIRELEAERSRSDEQVFTRYLSEFFSCFAIFYSYFALNR